MSPQPSNHRADISDDRRAVLKRIEADAEALDQQRAAKPEALSFDEVWRLEQAGLEDRLAKAVGVEADALRFQIRQRDQLAAERAKLKASGHPDADDEMDPLVLASRIPRQGSIGLQTVRAIPSL